jgi:hypothetical protein
LDRGGGGGVEGKRGHYVALCFGIVIDVGKFTMIHAILVTKTILAKMEYLHCKEAGKELCSLPYCVN